MLNSFSCFVIRENINIFIYLNLETYLDNQMSHRIITQNIALLFQEASKRFGALPAFATRESALKWKPVSYAELYRQGIELATGLIELGAGPRDHIGLFGDNRFEWILADYGVQLCGAADVPRGRDVTDAELVYILAHAGIKLVFVETQELQDRIVTLKVNFPGLREIIQLDPKVPSGKGVKSLQEVCELGARCRTQGDRRAEARIAGIRPDDLFTLIYTSGTTGQPKGVMLTHRNIISQINNIPGDHNCNDRILSVLPVWHIFERFIEMYTISFGGCTYYSSIYNIGDDMRNVEPTFMASAPRLWEKLHEKILKGIKASHPVRRVLFYIAYFLARQFRDSEYYLTGKYLRLRPSRWWKQLVIIPFNLLRWIIVLPWFGFFNAAVLERIRLGAGGSLKATISGGGALPLHIDKFFNYVGIPVLEGYGMTETSPVIAARSMDNIVIGTVGPPIPGTKIRIADPETGEILYPDDSKHHNGLSLRGEILVRGPQVMKGYYRDEELTKKTIRDGWLHTGDLGVMTHNNCLKILGRCKATIVLSSGENVEPEPIEMCLQQSQFIEHCMLVGQDKKFLAALIIPAITEFREAGFEERTIEELSANPMARKIIFGEIRRMTSASNGFKGYEQIRNFRLLPEKFQVGHELTSLHKIKRHEVEAKFNHLIGELFSAGSKKVK
jgi:long-chain acyl-CoA synthetase